MIKAAKLVGKTRRRVGAGQEQARSKARAGQKQEQDRKRAKSFGNSSFASSIRFSIRFCLKEKSTVEPRSKGPARKGNPPIREMI